MKRSVPFLPFKAIALLIGLAVFAASASAQTMHIEAQLVWGTDANTSPNPKHHPVDPDMAKRLSKLPFRWKHYFEVNRQVIDVAVGETKTKVPISKHCILDVKNLGGQRIDVHLHGDGKLVSRHSESLAKGGMLVLSGPADNNSETAWLVTLRESKLPVASIVTNRP